MKTLSQLFITAICSLQSWVTPIATAVVEREAPVEENQWCATLHEGKLFVTDNTPMLGILQPTMDLYSLIVCREKIKNNPKNRRL